MRPTLSCLLLSLAVSCGGPDAGPTTPEPPTTGEPAPAAQPADGARPCSAYVERGLRCMKQEGTAAGRDFQPAQWEIVEAALRDDCRNWIAEGVSRADLDAALEACEPISCSETSVDWQDCVVWSLRAAVSRSVGTASPAEWTRIAPRPIPEDAAPCEVYVDWMLECASEGLAPETVEATVAAMREGFDEMCIALRDAGMEPFVAEALTTCADVACGPGGGDWAMCVATAMAEAAMREAGAAP